MIPPYEVLKIQPPSDAVIFNVWQEMKDMRRPRKDYKTTKHLTMFWGSRGGSMNVSRVKDCQTRIRLKAYVIT